MDSQTGLTDDLEAVARGLKRLDQIGDRDRREAVLIALRLRDSATGPEHESRVRMRGRVLSTLPRARRSSAMARLLPVMRVLAAPAPFALRALAVSIVVGGLFGGAMVASADSLPDDLLYGWKLAAEEMRLAVATTSEDRATVRLSIAEHRLTEAQRLAEEGRDNAAIVATGEYGKQLAHAAAELAAVESSESASSPLIAQLEERLVAQLQSAAETASRLAADPARSEVALVLGAVAATAPPPAAGAPDTAAARIAANGAAVASRVAEVAIARIGPPEDENAARTVLAPTASPTATNRRRTPSSPALAVRPDAATPSATRAATPPPTRSPQRTARPTSTATTRPSATPNRQTAAERRADQRAREAAEKAKKAAQEAQRAAERANERAKRAAEKKSVDADKTPKPTPTIRVVPARR